LEIHSKKILSPEFLITKKGKNENDSQGISMNRGTKSVN
jgi:hypothetical protein